METSSLGLGAKLISIEAL